MSENSKIGWTDNTFNPWIGCAKVSPGCANCYADEQDKFRKWTAEGWGRGKPRKRTSAANWRDPVRWNAGAAARPLQCPLCRERYKATEADACLCQGYEKALVPNRPRVFCASLADWLDDEVPIKWLADLLELIRATPNLDWQLLTKRPENWRSRMEEAFEAAPLPSGLRVWISKWYDATEAPENVWIGTTVEDQERADLRIPRLLEIPARVRFLSCEPLLGEVRLQRILLAWPIGMKPIHWVICGGESGPNARPMHPSWARSLRDQCRATGMAFFFKQWGEYAPSIFGSGPTPDDLPSSAGYYFDAPHPPGKVWRFGKKLAGNLLDGQLHEAFPE